MEVHVLLLLNLRLHRCMQTNRPFNRALLRVAKNQKNKQVRKGFRFVEDFTSYEFEIRKKSTPDHERSVRPRQESPIYKRKAVRRR